MSADVEPPSRDHLRVSAQPRFLLHSDAVGWSDAFFADVLPALAGSVEHEHDRICMCHSAAPIRVRPNGRGPWRVIPSGVRVWAPGDKLSGTWQLGRSERSQFLFVTPGRVEAILERPFSVSTMADWYDQPRAAPHITPVVSALCADLAAGSPCGPLAGDSLIVALVGYLAAADGANGATRAGGLSPAIRRRVVEYIDAYLAKPLSLSELAAEARLSLRHLGRAFRVTMGQSPHQYVLRQRIERARGLIEAGDFSLAEIAGQVGFADQSQLTHTFRRVIGTTPGQYRALLRR